MNGVDRSIERIREDLKKWKLIPTVSHTTNVDGYSIHLTDDMVGIHRGPDGMNWLYYFKTKEGWEVSEDQGSNGDLSNASSDFEWIWAPLVARAKEWKDTDNERARLRAERVAAAADKAAARKGDEDDE